MAPLHPSWRAFAAQTLAGRTARWAVASSWPAGAGSLSNLRTCFALRAFALCDQHRAETPQELAEAPHELAGALWPVKQQRALLNQKRQTLRATLA